MNKALELLEKSRSVKEIAAKYAEAIARDIKVDVLDRLTKDKERLEFEIYALEDFSLDTDKNRGRNTMTKDEVQSRFVDIIKKKYELELIDAELKVKTAAYNKYFTEESAK